MSGKIFINYRRLESHKEADHLFTQLLRHFPSKRLFVDRHGIEGGKDWLLELERQVDASAVMLALIGKEWANIKDERGRRRLDDETDFVRFELAHALRRGTPIVPVLIDGAQMPRPEHLPANIQLLTRLQAMLLRFESFREDSDRIALTIKDILRQRRARPSTWIIGSAAAAAFVGGVIVGPWLLHKAGLPLLGTNLQTQPALEAQLADLRHRLRQSEVEARTQRELAAKLPTTERELTDARATLGKTRDDLASLDKRRTKELADQKAASDAEIANGKLALQDRAAEMKKLREEMRPLLQELAKLRAETQSKGTPTTSNETSTTAKEDVTRQETATNSPEVPLSPPLCTESKVVTPMIGGLHMDFSGTTHRPLGNVLSLRKDSSAPVTRAKHAYAVSSGKLDRAAYPG